MGTAFTRFRKKGRVFLFLWLLVGIFFASPTYGANITLSDTGVAAVSNQGKHSFGLDGCSDDFGDTGLACTSNQDTNRDTILIPFSGGLDVAAMGEPSSGAIIPNIATFLEIFETWQYNATDSSQCGPGETFDSGNQKCIGKFRANLADSYGRVIDTEDSDFSADTNGIPNDVLVIYLQGQTSVHEGMTVNPIGLQSATVGSVGQNTDATKNQIPRPTFPDVEFVASDKTQGTDDAAFDDGDTVTIFFDVDMDRTIVTNTGDISGAGSKVKPTQFDPWQEHSWGTGGSLAISWGNHNGSTCTSGGTSSDDTPDCLEITLGGSPTVKEGDEIMMQGMRSASGIPIGFGGVIDTIQPTATAIKSGSTKLIVTFSEEVMDDDDDDDWSNNFSTDAGTISDVQAISDDPNAGGGGGTGGFEFDPKKFEITVDSNTSTTQITVSNIVDEGGLSPASSTLSVSTDDTPPNICRIVRNDWDNNGRLNGGDELVFVFDNDGNSGNGCSTDIDYSSITNVNTDFVVKRSTVTVSNAFGQGADFWVDQFGDRTGELHIQLRQGADIQAGDEIFAASGEVLDLAGNAMDDSSAQFTIAKVSGGEIEKIVFDNVDNSLNTGQPTITEDDTFTVFFNSAIDPNTLGTYDGSQVTNIDWGLPLEHNFDANYGSGYTFVQKSWGSNSLGSWNGSFTQLTITIKNGGSPAPALGDFDLVQAYSVKTQDGGSIQKPGTIDLTAPTLKDVAGDPSVAGGAGTFDAGDQLIFIFSEAMDEATVTTGNIFVTDGDLGTAPSVTSLDAEKRVFAVTLGTSPDIDADGLNDDDTKFNALSAIKDLSGNGVNTGSAIAVNLNILPPVNNITLNDGDTTNPGIDGRDLTVNFDEDPQAGTAGIETYSLYLLPDFVAFDSVTQHPITVLNRDTACFEGSCSFLGTASLQTDSRSLNSVGDVDTNKPYFSLNELDRYNLYVIGRDSGSGETYTAKNTQEFQFSIEYGSDGQAPFVENSMPWDGAKNISTNNKNFSVRFNEALDRTSVETSGNIVMEKKSGETWNNVAVYVSYSESKFTAEIEPVGDLDTNSPYRIRVTTDVQDIGGTALANEFKSHFSTSGNTDSTGPKVSNYFFDGTTTTSNIPRNTFSISVAFNEDMDPSKFTSTAVTLSPNVPGSEINYDPFARTMNYFLGGPLEGNTEYTLTLSGLYLEDAAGNKLDGDGNGTAAGTTADNYTLTFTTENASLSTTKPRIDWIDSRGKEVLVGFSQRMDKATVEKKGNWTLTNNSGNRVDLQIGSFFYDGFINELRIEGLSLTPGENHTLTPNSSVLGMNGQDIDKDNSQLTFAPIDESGIFNATFIEGQTFDGIDGTFNGDMFAKMSGDNVADDIDFKTFMPISVWPMNQTAGKSTNYHINFPITQAIINGGKIILAFPTSFDISSAALATDPSGKLFFFNQDINGPGGTMTEGTTLNSTGKVQITNIAANNQTKVLTLTLSVDDGLGCSLDNTGAFNANCTDTNTTSTTMPYDFLDFELSGIVNGDPSEIDWSDNTGGYQVSITTKNASGKTLEGPIKSMKFDIKESGNGSIAGKVTASNGTTAVPNAKVFLDSPLAGHLETTTDSNGQYSFSQLPIASSDNPWDGWYHIWVEAPRDNDDYFGGQGFDLQLTSSSPTSTGNNVKLNSGGNTVTVTITHTDDDLDGEEVSLWAAGPNGWKDKKVTLDTDNSTSTTIKVSSGNWDFGIMPYFEHTAFGPGEFEQDFVPPKPVQKDISGDDSLSIALTSASLTIKGNVTDGSSGLANVEVYAYDPSGNGFGGHTRTSTDGSYTLKVGPGTYTVGAFKPGLPPIPEKTVEAKTDKTGINFTLTKSDSSISGTVTDGTNAIQYASVNAWTDDGRFASTQTDTQGKYTLFLPVGTWNLEVFAPGYGPLEPTSGTDITDISVTSGASITGKDFSVSEATYYLISGTIEDGSANGIPNVFVNADEVSFSGGSVGNFTGKGNGAQTDSNGSFSIRVKANTAGTSASATRYVLHAWSPDYGELSPDATSAIDVSAANSTGNDFTVGTKRTITVQVQNGDDLEKGAVDISEAFVDVFSPSQNKGNHRRFKDINLSSGDATLGTLLVSDGTNFETFLHIPGIGEFQGTQGGNNTFNISSDVTVIFDLQLDGGDILTFSGTVDDGTDSLSDAWVNVRNTTTDEFFGTATDDSGDYSIKVPAGTYNLRVDKPGYKSPPKVTGLTADDTGRTFSMTIAGSSITGTVFKSDGSTPASSAFVRAEETSGDGWSGIEVNSDGTYSLPVPTGTNWRIFADDDQGNAGSIATTVAAGATGQNITLSQSGSHASFISDQPKLEPITPNEGGVIDDEDNTGVTVRVPKNALGTGSNPGQIKSKETSAIPRTPEAEVFGNIGKELTATDSDGQPITNFNNDVTIELFYTKTEVESFADADNDAPLNGLEELDKMSNAYWDDTTQTWVSIPTTKTVQIKDDSGDEFSSIAFATFVSNVTSDSSDNTGSGGGTEKDYYDDYKIKLTSTTDHFTIFGAITGSDGVAPATPTSLSVSSAAANSVVLDWDDNAEGDLLEYQVFRGDNDGFTCNDSSQINTSAVTTSGFTDTTVGSNSYEFKYKVTAVDTSGNISACSSAVTASFTASSSSGGSGVKTSSNTNTAADNPLTFKTATPQIGRSTKMPAKASFQKVTTKYALNLSASKGLFTRPVILEDNYGEKQVSVLKDTRITTSDAKPFAGFLLPPKEARENRLPEKIPSMFRFVTGIEVGAANSEHLMFSQPFTLTIPLFGIANKDQKHLKVFTYNTTSKEYELVENGGSFDPVSSSISVQADHMSFFVVLHTQGQSLTSFTPEPTLDSTNVISQTPTKEAENSPNYARSIPERIVQPVPTFRDTRGHWARRYIDDLRERGVVYGKRDGEFEPDSPLTRAELTKVALKAFNINVPETIDRNPFPDVEKGVWYGPYIATAKSLNILQGYPDGKFYPNRPISRVEALKVLIETSALMQSPPRNVKFLDTLPGAWYEKYISFSQNHSLISPASGATFGPGKAIERGEMAKVISQLWKVMR